MHFHNGLPWFVPSSGIAAITLPGNWSFTHIHIYFNDYGECDCQRIATTVHEGFHVQQYFNVGLLGFGFIKLFMIDYLACWICNGFKYEGHPMEITAEEQELAFKLCCFKLQDKKICDCTTKPPTFHPEALEEVIKCNPSIVKEDGKVFKYDFGVICWILGAILAYYIMLVTIVTDLIFFIVEFVLLIATALGCALHIIWTTIIAMLDAICKWTIEWEKKCVDWAQESIKECLEYQTTGYQECSEYQDQGYNACTEYQDQGYSACAQTADQDIITVALGGPALGVVKQWYGFPI